MHPRPRGERRAGAVAGVDQPAIPEARKGRLVHRPVLRLANGADVGDEPQPGEVLEQRGVELGPRALLVVVLDPQHARADRSHGRGPTRTAHSRRGRGGGSPSAPAQTVSRRRAGQGWRQADRQASSGASRRRRSCASSAFVAAIIRRYIASRSACGNGPAFAIVTRRSTSRSRSTSAIARRPAASLARPTSRRAPLARSAARRCGDRARRSSCAAGASRVSRRAPAEPCAASELPLRTARRSCRAR